MAVTISFTLPGSQLESIEFDATIQEQHSDSATPTRFPIELGANISDHVLQEPVRLRLEGIVSNTPFPSQVNVPAGEFNQRAEDGEFAFRGPYAYGRLQALLGASVAVTISTELRDYESMVLTSLDVPRDAETADMLRFMAEFEKVTQVSTRSVEIALPRSQKPGIVKGGTKPKKEVEEAQSRPDSGSRALFGAVAK